MTWHDSLHGRRPSRVLMLVNVSWFFVSHRLVLALEAVRAGFEYHVATRVDPETDGIRLRSLGLHLHPLPFARGSSSPVADLRSIFAIARTYTQVQPDVVHLVTIKAIILGGLLARLMHVPGVVAAVPGLGYAFVSRGPWAALRRKLIHTLLRIALRRRECIVVFQNPEDMRRLIDAGVIAQGQTVLIRGAGVDMQAFQSADEPGGRVRVLLASRMLREKGVAVFVEAARILRAQGVDAEFLLAGAPDPDNPGSLSRAELEAWQADGPVTWLGHVSDIGALLRAVHVVCLPTYYGEGVPKSLIEAAATGRAIVATDVPGCREIVRDGSTGLLVPPRDAPALAGALRRIIEDRALRCSMGAAGRRLALEGFSQEQVIEETLAVYRRLVQRGDSA